MAFVGLMLVGSHTFVIRPLTMSRSATHHPARRSAARLAASTGDQLPSIHSMGEPLPPAADSPFDLAMIGAFRLAMGNMAGWQSSRPFFRSSDGKPGESYRGLVEVSRRLFARSPSQTVDRVVGVLQQFPTQPQFLRDNKPSAELLGVLTPPLFRFLVGPSKTEAWLHPSGEQWQSRVVIERCRFLTEAGCKGMCIGLCKSPTEQFFNEQLGLPLSMEPNFENGTCTMTWGERPRADTLSGQDVRCFSECSLRLQSTSGALTMAHAAAGATSIAGAQGCEIVSEAITPPSVAPSRSLRPDSQDS